MDDLDPVLATIATESDAVFLYESQPSMQFGRSADCPIRIGHQPLSDTSVPRVAGAIVALDHRIGVDNIHEQVAIDVRAVDGPLQTVRPGDLVALSATRFEIIVQGMRSSYMIAVRRVEGPRPLPIARSGREADGLPTGISPDLTERQWQILEAYTAPLRRGEVMPATHREVARTNAWAYATVRCECNEIWGAFKVAGVPMREFRDKRDAVVDAAIRHRLTNPT